MKIIDFDKKGNIVRFYLGEKTEEWGWTNPEYKNYKGETPDWLKPQDKYYGDDWDDAPYDCNAGQVYDEFIKGHIDVAFPFDCVVFEPCDGGDWNTNCRWCKDDMRAELIPCIVAQKIFDGDYAWKYDYNRVVARKDSAKIYFNMDEEELKKLVEELGGKVW